MRKSLPTKKDYDFFVKGFADKLSQHFPDICFYVYGSYASGKANYGRSDIDGGLILNEEFISPKNKIIMISDMLKQCLDKRRVKTQFNLLDRGTNKDGRFLSYIVSYTDWIKRGGVVICGPDYRQEMKGLDFKAGELEAASFNFRRIRNGLLYSSGDIIKGYNQEGNFGTSLEKAIIGLKGLAKKLIFLQCGKLYPEASESFQRIRRMFPELNLEVLKKVNALLRNPRRFREVLESGQSEELKFYQDILTQFEQIIQAYVVKFPKVSEREARG